MEKIRLLFWASAVFILSSLPIQAKHVNAEKAEKAARSYAQITPRLTARKNFHLSHTISQPVKRNYPGLRSAGQEEEPVYYVFTMNGEGGFIIISGDDVVKPVLGYSDTGTFDKNNPNLACWMETLAEEIASAIENNFPQDAQTQAAWDALESGRSLLSESSGDYVDPLIKTKWNQDAPYNKFCPEQRYTGCVATAMAQIMNYYKYPATRTVTIPGYKTRTDNISIPAITGTTDYDWNRMLNTYSSFVTEAQQNAVATLMYHCGVGVKMDYHSTGSGAYSHDVAPALRNYFNYDAGIDYYWRDYCSYEHWINLLKTELKANRPVYYSGQGSDGGHAFVCDGYDTGGLFHFNWGWGGSSDGYFEVSALNPGSTGIGGGSGGFNSNQNIATCIQPPTGSDRQPPVRLGLATVSANISGNRIAMSAAELKNLGLVTVMDAYLGVLLCNQDNSYRDHKTVKQIINLGPGYYYPISYAYPLLQNYSLPAGLPVGVYKLYPAYSDSSGIPDIISGKNGTLWYFTVTVDANDSVTLSNTASNDITLNGSVTISGSAVFGETLTAETFGLTSTPNTVLDSLSFQWKRDSEDIRGDTGNTYTLVKADIAKTISVTVTAKNCRGSVSSAATSPVEKAAQYAPPAPAAAGITATSITLTAIAEAQYCVEGGIWQNSPIFNNLSPNTEYTFQAKLKENETHKESPASQAVIRTNPAEITTLNGSVTISGSAVFGETLTAETFGLTSTPDAVLSSLSFRWKRGSEDISGATGNTYTLVKADISKTISVTVTAENCLGSVSSAATSPVEKAAQYAPPAPAAEDITATSIILTAIAEAQYCVEGGIWQNSPIFNNLSPNTEYTFHAKLKENETHKESPASQAVIRTNPAEITINGQPEDKTFIYGSVNGNLCLMSTVTNGLTLSYQWYGNTFESNEGGIPVSGATDACFTIPNILAAGTYYYYCTVSATGKANPVVSRVATVTVNDWKTAIPAAEDESAVELRLYPNPFSDELYLKGAKGCTLRIFTPDGILIHIRKIMTASDEIIRLKHLPAGIYLFRLDRDGKTKTIWGVKREK
jgi:hypothetical protein